MLLSINDATASGFWSFLFLIVVFILVVVLIIGGLFVLLFKFMDKLSNQDKDL